MKHLISLNDLSREEFEKVLSLAQKLKRQNQEGVQHHLLANKTLGMIFTKSSTRTRVSFEVGMYQLGGYALFLSSQDIQLGRGEPIYDTAQVLSRYINGIMIRTFAHSDVEDLARYGTIPVINGLTDREHPCQILADLLTVQEHKGRLEGLKLAYVGDGNNIANSLLHGCAIMGMDIAVATPDGYDCDPLCVDQAQSRAKSSGSRILLTHDPESAVASADVIVTDTWVSMGQENEKAQRIATFGGYQVNDAMMARAREDAIFLHCLPAYRGYEVTESVIDGPQSVIFDEAENRLHAQKAVMALCMAN